MELLGTLFDLLSGEYQKKILSVGSVLAKKLSGDDGLVFAGVVIGIFMLIAVIEYMTEGDIVALLTGIVKKWLVAAAVLLALTYWGLFIKAGLAMDKYLYSIVLGNKPEEVLKGAAVKLNSALRADLNALSNNLEPSKKND